MCCRGRNIEACGKAKTQGGDEGIKRARILLFAAFLLTFGTYTVLPHGFQVNYQVRVVAFGEVSRVLEKCCSGVDCAFPLKFTGGNKAGVLVVVMREEDERFVRMLFAELAEATGELEITMPASAAVRIGDAFAKLFSSGKRVRLMKRGKAIEADVSLPCRGTSTREYAVGDGSILRLLDVQFMLEPTNFPRRRHFVMRYEWDGVGKEPISRIKVWGLAGRVSETNEAEGVFRKIYYRVTLSEGKLAAEVKFVGIERIDAAREFVGGISSVLGPPSDVKVKVRWTSLAPKEGFLKQAIKDIMRAVEDMEVFWLCICER